MKLGKNTPPKPCKIEECTKKRYANISWCYAHYKAREKAKREEKKAKALIRKQGTKKFQKSEQKRWHKKCWTLMSLKVRQRGMDEYGTVRCFTCGVPKHWKDMNAGHFQHGKLDFDERNLRVQCVRCNLHNSGMLDAYTMRLIKENSVEWVEELIADAWQHLGYKTEELKTIYETLKGS